MQYLILAYDGLGEGVLERRMAVREEHLKLVEAMSKEKKHLYAVAILDEKEKIIGSALIVDFPSREELDEYLQNEPYVKAKVWQNIEVKPCKVGPMFMDLHK